MANEITQQTTMNVFVTGASTPIGRAVTRALSAAGHRVFGAIGEDPGAARQVRADGAIPAYPDLLRAGEIRSAMSANAADVVVHLATQTANQVPQLGGKWDEKGLIDGAAALIEAAIAANVKYVVYTSYVFAGGEDARADSLIDAARLGEQLALSGQMPACVLRFGFLYGAESPELVHLRDHMKLGRPVHSGSTTGHAYWTHVGDAASAIVRAIQLQPANVTLNVADDHPATPHDFMTYFAESQGYSRPSSRRAPTLRDLLGTPAMDVGAIGVHADTSDAKTTLGWSPRFADYREGIDDMLLSWRASGA